MDLLLIDHGEEVDGPVGEPVGTFSPEVLKEIAPKPAHPANAPIVMVGVQERPLPSPKKAKFGLGVVKGLLILARERAPQNRSLSLLPPRRDTLS